MNFFLCFRLISRKKVKNTHRSFPYNSLLSRISQYINIFHKANRVAMQSG
jgi:hypothetical protein